MTVSAQHIRYKCVHNNNYNNNDDDYGDVIVFDESIKDEKTPSGI